jgi:hypothetical protein
MYETRILAAPVLLALLLTTACSGMPFIPGAGAALGALTGGGGLNPVSAAVGVAGMAASTSIGMANAGTISPAEQAQYAALSCPELKSMVERYQTASTMPQNSSKYFGMHQPIATETIGVRLKYLSELSLSKGC